MDSGVPLPPGTGNHLRYDHVDAVRATIDPVRPAGMCSTRAGSLAREVVFGDLVSREIGRRRHWQLHYRVHRSVSGEHLAHPTEKFGVWLPCWRRRSHQQAYPPQSILHTTYEDDGRVAVELHAIGRRCLVPPLTYAADLDPPGVRPGHRIPD